MADYDDLYVGAKVECMVDNPDDNPDIVQGSSGTVCVVDDGAPRIGVEWDFQLEGGHNCNGRCKQGYGWYVDISDVRVVEQISTEFEVDGAAIDEFLGLFTSMVGGAAR